jgi:hypothetical protein
VEGRKSGDGVGIGYISINLFVREPSFLFFSLKMYEFWRHRYGVESGRGVGFGCWCGG